MSLARPITFWITMLAAGIVVVVLLREVLLPFVAGMMLKQFPAYLNRWDSQQARNEGVFAH
jgi:hypothetical protein